MPAQLRVDLQGHLPAGVTAKDVVLHLLALPEIRAGAGVGKVFEFTGSVIAALSIDERATLTNMTAELGGTTGIVAPDAQTIRFLKERRGIDFVIESWLLRAVPYARRTRRPWSWPAFVTTQARNKDQHRLRRLMHRWQARRL
jgi:homoaconitase/3-isopropylmalate dehydratase large subunit